LRILLTECTAVRHHEPRLLVLLVLLVLRTPVIFSSRPGRCYTSETPRQMP